MWVAPRQLAAHRRHMSASVSSTNGDAQSEEVARRSDDEQSLCISEATLNGSGEHSLVEVNDLIKPRTAHGGAGHDYYSQYPPSQTFCGFALCCCEAARDPPSDGPAFAREDSSGCIALHEAVTNLNRGQGDDDAVDEEDAGWDSDMSDPEDNR